MKKHILFLVFIVFGLVGTAQVFKRNKLTLNTIQRMKTQGVCYVKENSLLFDQRMVAAMKRYWTFSPFKIISEKERDMDLNDTLIFISFRNDNMGLDGHAPVADFHIAISTPHSVIGRVSYIGFEPINWGARKLSRKERDAKFNYTGTLIQMLNDYVSYIPLNDTVNWGSAPRAEWIQLYDVFKAKREPVYKPRLIIPDFVVNSQVSPPCVSAFIKSYQNALVVNRKTLKKIFNQKNKGDYFLYRGRHSWSIVRIADGMVVYSDAYYYENNPCKILALLESYRA